MKKAWFRILFTESDNRLPQPFEVDDDNLPQGSYFALEQGELQSQWPTTSWYRSSSVTHDGEPEDVILHLMIPLLSPRLHAALQAADIGSTDVQYLPVQLIKSTGGTIDGYSIANILTRVEALDRERCFMLSESDTIDPATGKREVSGIGRIAVWSNPLEGHDLARLREYYPPVLVSQNFAEVFLDLKCTGCRLAEVEVDRNFTHWLPR